MRKRLITFEKICVLLLVITIILSSYAGICIHRDLASIREDSTESALNSNTYIYGKQLDQVFNRRLDVVKSLATCVSMFNRNDTSELNRLMQGYNNVFSDIGVIDIYGNFVSGNQFSFQDISKESFYEDLMNGKAVIASELYRDPSGDDAFYFLAPVIQNGSTQMIVIGSMASISLVQNFDTVDYVGSGCLCIINTDGDYLLGSTSFTDMLGDKENNHFFHVGSRVSGKIQTAIEKGEKISVEYIYAGKEYDAIYVPLNMGSWYLVATVPLNEDAIQEHVLSVRSFVMLGLAVLTILVTVLCFVGMAWLMHRFRKENNRHVLLQQCDRAVSFELSFKPHILRFYGDLKGIIGTDVEDLYGEAVYDIYDWIHEDDASLRSRLNHYFDSGEEKFSTEIRIRHIKGSYRWYRIVGIMQKDLLHKKNSIFVGKIMNVDEEMAEEKDLIQRAENDLLTGVLNKTTMEKRISLMLKDRGNQYVIFYMVDLDNFKNVNDTLGHIYGDKAIVDTAQALNKVFADQDCVGRLGGDEFAVCVTYQAFDEQNLLDFIKKKAEKICQVNRRTYTDGVSKVSITSSVGIAYAPDMGESFEELYTKADRALYFSKENGKNRYHIYSEEDD